MPDQVVSDVDHPIKRVQDPGCLTDVVEAVVPVGEFGTRAFYDKRTTTHNNYTIISSL